MKRSRKPVWGYDGAFSFFLSLGAGETSGSVRGLMLSVFGISSGGVKSDISESSAYSKR